MTPRPLHRWKSFWFGILVLGFICWAWRDSMVYTIYTRCGPFAGVHCVGGLFVEVGSVSRLANWRLDRVHDQVRVRMTEEGFIAFSSSPRKTEPASPWPRPLTQKRAVNVNSGVFLPHWLILLACATPWSAFLVWRWRRLRNLTKIAL